MYKQYAESVVIVNRDICCKNIKRIYFRLYRIGLHMYCNLAVICVQSNDEHVYTKPVICVQKDFKIESCFVYYEVIIESTDISRSN